MFWRTRLITSVLSSVSPMLMFQETKSWYNILAAVSDFHRISQKSECTQNSSGTKQLHLERLFGVTQLCSTEL